MIYRRTMCRRGLEIAPSDVGLSLLLLNFGSLLDSRVFEKFYFVGDKGLMYVPVWRRVIC